MVSVFICSLMMDCSTVPGVVLTAAAMKRLPSRVKG